MIDRLQFYGDSISGNCYKLQLAAAELDIDYTWHEMDVLSGATQSAEFLDLNANGKVPLMVMPDGRCLPESNAILSYLAHDSGLAGNDRFARAQVLQWLFFEQYSHEPFIATSRFIVKYLGSPADRSQSVLRCMGRRAAVANDRRKPEGLAAVRTRLPATILAARHGS